jgi:hypothetical protein
MRLFPLLACAAVIAACASPATTVRRDDVLVTPDAAHPGAVRFDVPTAMLMDLPGGRVPVTLEARIATRAIASRELAQRGLCPRGFTGPDGIAFPDGDRGRSVFYVECVGG